MLVINNWKVKVIWGYLAIRVITFANKLPEGKDKKKKKDSKIQLLLNSCWKSLEKKCYDTMPS